MSKGFYYDATAKGYDNLHQEEQERKLKHILPHIEVNLNDWFLDIGCGTCVSFPFFDCKYKFGLDPSIGLLKNIKPNRHTGGYVINGQGESLPFKSDLFDLVICMTAIHNFDDIRAGIDEMKRVTKEGATIVVTVLKKIGPASKIVELIKDNLQVVKELDDFHDHMFICTK